MAKTNRLTNELIETTNSTNADQWLSDDDGNRGWGRLVVRISPNGDRRFYFRYSIEDKRISLALGQYAKRPTPGRLTLADARKIAVRYSALHRDAATRDVRKHVAPSEIRTRANAPSADSTCTVPSPPVATNSLLDLCNVYLLTLAKRNAQSTSLTENYIKNHIAPTQWATIAARDVRPSDVAALLRQVIEAGKGTTARKVRQVLHASYALAIKGPLDPNAPAGLERFGVEVNPVSATPSLAGLSKPGDRALDRFELGAFWMVLMSRRMDLSLPIRFIRVSILLGGQRAKQLLRCTQASVEFDDTSFIKLIDGKGRRLKPRVHSLPIPPVAKAEIEWLLQHSQNLGSPFLFSGRQPDKPLTDSPISHSVRRISNELVESGIAKSPFRYADIRRTIETNMAALNIGRDVRAQIQSHGLGGIQAQHYDRWDYYPQKWEALTRWEKYLAECADAAREKWPNHKWG